MNKEQLKALWTAPTAWEWRRARTQWLPNASQNRVPALVQFARRLRGYLQGIVNRVCRPAHIRQLEGINNTIKMTKRMA